MLINGKWVDPKSGADNSFNVYNPATGEVLAAACRRPRLFHGADAPHERPARDEGRRRGDFGPVVCAMPFEKTEEVSAQMNNSPFGLAGAIWTQDLSKAHRMAKAMKSGTVWINCYNVFDAALPFGGYKQSGWGREMGREVFELYTQVKSVCIKI
jgi:acyl-CoA reductase-like NAD-dependent aldehyde dehydrogenase